MTIAPHGREVTRMNIRHPRLAAMLRGAFPLLLLGCLSPADELPTDLVAQTVCGSSDLTNETGVSVIASSAKSGRGAAKAIDNSLNGFWESTSCSAQSLEVNLGAVRTVSGVNIDWDYNYASAFSIQVYDGVSSVWNTVLAAAGTAGADQDNFSFAAQVTQKVRILVSSCSVSSSGAGGAATVSVNEI